MALTYHTSYGQAFLSRPALRAQRHWAMFICLILLALGSCVIPFAGKSSEPNLLILPIFSTALFLCNGFISLLLGFQSFQLKHGTLAVLAGAYLFLSLSNLLYLLLWPQLWGMKTPWFDPLHAEQIRTWLSWLARIGFPFFIMVAVGQAEQAKSKLILTIFWFAPVFVMIFLAAGLTYLPQTVPIVHIEGKSVLWTPILQQVIMPFYLLALFLSFRLLARKSRFRTRLHLWLSVALTGMVIQVILIWLTPGRWSIGWYASAWFSVFTSMCLLIALLWDIHDQQSSVQRLNEELHREANHDALTGLLLRRPFHEKVKDLVKQHLTSSYVLMIDIDDFKAYNDTFGHLSGDACLALIAKTIHQKVAQFGGVVARTGGEEMAVALAGTVDPKMVAETIRQSIEQLQLPHAAKARHKWVTVSIGWATYEPGPYTYWHKDQQSQWFKNADDALYAAKHQGRNCCLGYEELSGILCAVDQESLQKIDS